MVRTDVAPFHVTSRVNNQDWYLLPMEEVWSIYRTHLTKTIERYGILLHAFVLMANHFHLITSTPNRNLSEAMRYLLTEVSRDIGRRVGRINHIFGGRYRWSVLWQASDLAYVYKYIYRNPLRAGLCERVEEYKFSTLTRLLRNSCDLPIIDGFGPQWQCIPREPAARVRWMNLFSPPEAERLITLALRRFEFALPTHKARIALKRELEATYAVPAPPDPERAPVDKSEK